MPPVPNLFGDFNCILHVHPIDPDSKFQRPLARIVVLLRVYHRVLLPRVVVGLEEVARVGAAAEVPSKAQGVVQQDLVL